MGHRMVAVILAFAFAALTAQPQAPLSRTYQKWLDEDVAYIIHDEERASFQRLQNDEERDRFIVQFWERRNPRPGTAENVYKEEHYRRIAYSNVHFAGKNPGWRTDRGRIYITLGPPARIERHFDDPPAYERWHSESWHYEHTGAGSNVTIEFVDPKGTGDFRISTRPRP